MTPGPSRLHERVEQRLWPLVETFLGSQAAAGLAVAVVCEGEVVARGFGVRDLRTGTPVTAQTMFHLASVSKPFVATAVVSLATGGPAGERAGERGLDLDAPIIDWVPEFTLADGRAGEVTARALLSHTSGLPDVSDYGWHDPQLGDDALEAFARSLSGWRLRTEPGAAFSYSNAGYELLGLLLSRVTGTTFEEAVRQEVLAPLGMATSTFLRSEVPVGLAASPHVGMPLAVPGGAYPYTRRHAPSSTLHSNLVEMCRWLEAWLRPVSLDPELLDLMWRPVMAVNEPPWEHDAALGWFLGSYRGLRTVGHSGADPGFGSRLVLVPERRLGVVVLANSNTAPTSAITMAALDVALADPFDLEASDQASVASVAPVEGLAALRAMRASVVGPVADVLATAGLGAAAATYHRLAATKPREFDFDDEEFEKAVWGAIELHRTDLVWPLLRLWTQVRPESSTAWTMSGWAYQVDGDPERARQLLRRALDLDPEDGDARIILGNLPSIG